MPRPLLALLALDACISSQGVVHLDTSDPTKVDLSGNIGDPYLDYAPVDGAWVLLDLGDEQLSIRTGSDGSFSMPGLPADSPMSFTVAAEGYLAVTYADVVLEGIEMPLQLGTHLRSLDSYATESMTISGTVSDAPLGSYVFFFGATDEASDSSYLDYVQVATEEPVEFELQPALVLPGTEYTLGALAFDGSDWIVQAAGASTVSWGGSEQVELSLDPDELQSLAVSAAFPSLDGQIISAPPEEYCHSIAVTHLGESMSTTTGYNRSCDDGSEALDLDLGWVPIEGYTDRLQLYLFEDLSTGSYAFGSLKIPQGANELEVELLDSPVLDHADSVSQGDSISWQPVDGASGYMLYGYDEQGSLAWYLYPGTDRHSIALPRFPADFDVGTIAEQGSWAVISRHIVTTDEGDLDQSEDYTGSISQGGAFQL